MALRKILASIAMGMLPLYPSLDPGEQGTLQDQQVFSKVADEAGGPVLFDPTHQKPIRYEDNTVEIAAVAKAGKLALEVENKEVPGKRVLQMPEDLAQVNEIRRVQDGKATVIGMVNGDVWEVVIVDLGHVTLSDRFLCYEPAVSPDGQYVSFVKFFPPHGGDDPEYHYMLYDLSKDADANRPPGIPPTNWKTVGVTVYPTGVGNREFDTLRHPAPAAHMLSSEGFFWNPAGESFVFADEYNGRISVVVVSINSQRLATTRVASAAELCGDASPSAGCSFRLVKVEFGSEPSGPLTLAFEGTLRNIGQKRVLRFSSSGFSTVGITRVP